MGLDEVRTLEVLIFEDETSGSKREAGLGLEIQTQTCALASVLVAIMIPRCQCHDQYGSASDSRVRESARPGMDQWPLVVIPKSGRREAYLCIPRLPNLETRHHNGSKPQRAEYLIYARRTLNPKGLNTSTAGPTGLARELNAAVVSGLGLGFEG